jgi:protease I
MTKKIAILATDDFEDSELQVPYERLKDAGFKVLLVGPVEGKEIRGKKGRFSIETNLSVDSVNEADFDALVIPGGYSPDRLRLNPAAVELVRAFMNSGKPVAAICHAPQLLVSAGVLKDRTLTCWPSVSVDVKNAGGNYVDEAIVIDRNLITSRKPDDLPVFVDAVIAALEEGEEQLSA